MKIQSEGSVRPVRNGQRGQTFVMVAILLPVLLGMAALVIDLGYAYVSFQQLQAATQAAALAGGGAIPNVSGPTAVTAAVNYSALNLNKYPNLQNVSLSINLACVDPSLYPNLGLPPCAVYPSCPSGCNMIQVQETAKVSTFFAKIFGVTNVPLSSSATAAARGGGIPPYHIMMVLDATPSMGFGLDTGCTQNGTSVTPEQCAEYGVQTLLLQLNPCAVTLATCTPGSQPGTSLNPNDQVGIMMFPGLCSLTTSGLTTTTCNNAAHLLPATAPLTNTIANTTYAPDEYTCPATNPPLAKYNNNPEYLILGFQSNYRFSDASGLNTNANLFKTIGAGTNNCGITPPPGESTFYGGAIQAAQDYLTANNTVGVQNVMIILSDGDANDTADMGGAVKQIDGPSAGLTYPNTNECQQAVQAANYAKTNGTLIYSISYGSETTGCSTDNAGSSVRTPCATMQGMSSLPLSQYFFSIPMHDSSNPTQTTICANAVPLTSLNQVFTTIASQLTVSRLVPGGDF
jgi:Putative Flp pilus-assembly TadE/G-like